MSYPVTDVIQLAPTTTAAGSYAASLTKLSGDWANDDWIFLAIACSNVTGGVTLSTATAGWSEIVELDVSSGVRMAVYKAKVASGTVADPTISLSSGTGLWSVFAWIERDADATDPCPANHYGTADSGVASSFSSATLTPGAGTPVDNCRIVYFAATRGTSDVYLRMLDSSVVGDSLLNISDGSVSMAAMIGSTSQTTAAATAKTIYASASPRSGCITLAIKPGSGGKRAQQATLGIERLAWLGSFGVAHDGALTPVTTSWGAPTSRTISGVTVSTTAATRITNVVSTNEWGSYDSHSCTLATAGWQGNMLTFSADVDMSGKLFAVEWGTGGFFSQVGDQGLIVVFEDNGGTNWEAFQLSQKTGVLISRIYGTVIDIENATPYDSAGTLAWSGVRKVSFLLHRSGASAAARSFSLKNMLLLSKTTLMGGNVDKPLTINYLRQALHGMGYSGLVGGDAPAVTIRSDVQIGDTGTTTTYYDATGTLHAFPDAYDSLTQREVNIPANQLDLTIDAGPDDTINLTATAISATLEQNLTFASGTDAGAEYSTQGASIIGVLATGRTAVPQVGATYSGCDEVAFGGADVTNVTITDTTSTDAACSFDADGAVVTSSTIDGTGALYAIELGTAVTAITLADCTITAGSTDKVHVKATTGTVTITISGTTSLAAGDVTTDGATVVIAAPELYQSVTVSGAIANSQIHVADVDYTLTVSGITITPTAGATYAHNDITWTVVSASITAGAGTMVVYGLGSPDESGTLTKASGTGDASVAFSAFVRNVTTLYNGAPTFPYTWTDSVAAAAARAIRLRVAYCQTTSARSFIESYIGVCGITDGSESVSYNASQVADATYNTHALDGPAILALGEITISDLGTDLITVDTAGGTMGWPTIYAAFVAWMASSSGIDDEIAYCDSPDPVNFIWENTRIKCPIGTALSVTDGWGRDSVTGLSITLWDNTGGAIGFSADHGIGYSTGSGLTTAQNAKLMALPDATDIATEVVSGITF